MEFENEINSDKFQKIIHELPAVRRGRGLLRHANRLVSVLHRFISWVWVVICGPMTKRLYERGVRRVSVMRAGRGCRAADNAENLFDCHGFCQFL